MNKRIAAGISAGLVAGAFAISCVPPVTAHADYGDFAGYLDYVVGESSTAYASLGGGTDALTFAGYALLFRALYNYPDITEGWVEEGVMLPSEHIAIAGEYQYQGVIKPGVLISYDSTVITSSGFSVPMFTSEDITIDIGFTYSSPVTVRFSSGSIPNNSAVQMFSDNYSPYLDFTTSNGFSGNTPICGLNYNNFVPNWDNSLPGDGYVRHWNNLTASGIISGAQYVDIPGGDFSPGNIINVWNDSILPDLQNRPSLEPYIPDPYTPDAPYEPIYPTGDYVTGIPKDWTIEKPNIPEYPHIGFDISDADFDVIKPSEQIAEYTDGIGFWWALTSRLLDVTNLKVIAVLALGLGVLGFVLWRLGR